MEVFHTFGYSWSMLFTGFSLNDGFNRKFKVMFHVCVLVIGSCSLNNVYFFRSRQFMCSSSLFIGFHLILYSIFLLFCCFRFLAAIRTVRDYPSPNIKLNFFFHFFRVCLCMWFFHTILVWFRFDFSKKKNRNIILL